MRATKEKTDTEIECSAVRVKINIRGVEFISLTGQDGDIPSELGRLNHRLGGGSFSELVGGDRDVGGERLKADL